MYNVFTYYYDYYYYFAEIRGLNNTFPMMLLVSVLEKLCSLVLRFWKSLSSCFCWTTLLWNALKAVKFIIDFIFHSLLNGILYLVLNKTSTEPSTAFSRYACVGSGKCPCSSKWGYKWSSRCNSQSKCKRFVSHGENLSYLQWN